MEPADTLEYRVSNYLETDDFHEAIREMYRGLSSIQSLAEFGKIRSEISSLIEGERRIRSAQTLENPDPVDMRRRLDILKLEYGALAVNIDKLLQGQLNSRGEQGLGSTKEDVTIPPAVASALAGINLERLWGRQNLKAIGWLKRGLERSQSVCRIGSLTHGVRAPHFFGTGFLIAGEWMVTAAHNFMYPDDDRPREELLRRCVVQFGYDDEYLDLPDDDVCQYKIDMDNVIFAHDPSIDCAIVRLKPDPDHLRTNFPVAHWNYLPIEAAALEETPHAVVLRNDFVPIIQHPKGEPKQVAVTSNEVLGVEDNWIWYTTDTERGSSGAPVFNERWFVVGIHLGVAKKGMRPKSARHQLYPNAGLPIRRVAFDKNLSAAFSR